LLIDSLGSFQDVKINANRGGQLDEGLNILWETKATKAEPGTQELCLIIKYCMVRTCRYATIKDSKPRIRLVSIQSASVMSHFGDTNGLLYMEIPPLQDTDCAYNRRKT
jgi:hypothetical protein